jgi:hypothetical protein
MIRNCKGLEACPPSFFYNIEVYKVLPDEGAEKEGYLRIIDESGQDYLYPQSFFVLVQLPREAQEALRVAI